MPYSSGKVFIRPCYWSKLRRISICDTLRLWEEGWGMLMRQDNPVKGEINNNTIIRPITSIVHISTTCNTVLLILKCVYCANVYYTRYLRAHYIPGL